MSGHLCEQTVAETNEKRPLLTKATGLQSILLFLDTICLMDRGSQNFPRLLPGVTRLRTGSARRPSATRPDRMVSHVMVMMMMMMMVVMPVHRRRHRLAVRRVFFSRLVARRLGARRLVRLGERGAGEREHERQRAVCQKMSFHAGPH
jgi:hypothetical protein